MPNGIAEINAEIDVVAEELTAVDRPQFAPCEHPMHGHREGDQFHPEVLGELRQDPFEHDVNDRAVYTYLCPRCYAEVSADI
jgi:hypothetical protein